MDMEKMQRIMVLRKKQGWDGAYVEGELTAMMWLLENEGKTPEDIAKRTLQEDWLSFVATFV